MLDTSPGGNDSVLVQVSRMGERVAAVEARLEALKGDTEITRASIHSINQELQKIVIVEEGCRQSLLHLTTQVTMLVQAAPALAAGVQTFEGMRNDLRDLLTRQAAKTNAATHAQRFLPWLIALGGLAWWAWEHLLVK